MHRVPTATASDGTPIMYDVHGDGPPMILVHGIAESARTWDPLIEDLARAHRLLVPDLRGHGRSGSRDPYALPTFAADVNAVATNEGVDGPDVILVGHSLGGTVVTAYAAMFPCCAVVNIDQPLDLGSFQQGLRQLAPLLRGSETDFGQAIAMVFDSMRGPLSPTETTRVEGIRRPEQAVVLGVWDAVIDTPIAELDELVQSIATGVKVPYLSLHGLDPGVEYPAWLQSLIPTAIVEVWEDHGHYPHLVDSPRFLDRLASFEASFSQGS